MRPIGRRRTGWVVGCSIVLLISVTCGGSSSPTAPAGSQQVHGSGVMARKNVAVGGFTAIDHSAVGDVHIEGGGPKAVVITAEDNILPYLDARVVGGVLRLTNQPGVTLRVNRTIKYRVTGATVDRIELKGVGDIVCDYLKASRLMLAKTGIGELRFSGLDLDELEVDLSGVGSARAVGSANRQTVQLSGVDDYEAGSLSSERAHVRVLGVGSATVRVSQHLSGSVSGAGCIYYFGDPVLDVTVTGSGCVERLGD